MTIYSLSESIRALIEGSSIPSKPKFTLKEVKIAAVQVINGMLKAQHLTEEMSGGEAIPDGSILAEYDNISVESYKGVARCTLPAMPIKLLLNMGVFHVSKTSNIIDGFIPFESGQLQMIGEEPLLSDILGQVGYEQRGQYLIFNRDINTNEEEHRITEVYMLLAVKDLSLYGDFEMLPISSSMEMDVIQATFQILTGQMPSNKKVDVINKQPE
jgi:hypothetical protein